MEKLTIQHEVSKIIRQHLGNHCKIVLFGSWARGDAVETSDIDIGILDRQPVPWEIMTKITEAVERLPTLRSVDIVDLNTVGKTYREGVLRYAQTL